MSDCDGSPSTSSSSCRRFSLADIQSATDNFSDELVIGLGGFGKVYKGSISDGESMTVAVKRLNPGSRQGAREFRTEIEMLSRFRYPYLVSLIGYCEEPDEMVLVYEYMPRGNFADHLHRSGKNYSAPLPWLRRLRICIDAARGLDYLHTGTSIQPDKAIHRDVKSSNILLDHNWDAKISDFGLSKLGPEDQAYSHVSTDVKGTFGYLDPEYYLTRRLTRKSDVYAFGVVMLEALCGRPAVDLSGDEEQWGLAGWAQYCIGEGTVDEIIDPSVKEEIKQDCLMEFVQIAVECLRNIPRKRPTMAEIVVRLEFALAMQEGKDSSKIVKPAKMNFTRKVQRYFLGTTSVRAKTVKSGNKSASPNKDGDIDQEIPPSGENVTQKVKVFTFAELKIAAGNSVFEAGKAFWVDKKTYARSKAGIGMAVTVECIYLASQDLLGVQKDQDFNPKLIGFGIDLVNSNEIPDMTGYYHPSALPIHFWVPEYNGNMDDLTVKSDVYGFGVVLLQLLTGRPVYDRSRPFRENNLVSRVYDRSRPFREINLVSWVWPFLTHKRRHKMIMDARLKDEYPSRGSFQVTLLAQSCLAYDPEARPSMEEVLEALRKVSAI
ncbi:hypothetical protein RJ640_002830 [Escallonia rubra]|uniref:Protein kinase domain-containing protein n=1 Tax=Escallonia rubra TaxID=112253 RepID=A0AA88R2P6_9ASTE|nr:hypothetical protein RJ640_002830 [Escallonia rubra]